MLVFPTLTHVGPLRARICTTNTLLPSRLQYLKMNSKKVRVSPRSNLGGSVRIASLNRAQFNLQQIPESLKRPGNRTHARGRGTGSSDSSHQDSRPILAWLSKVTWLVGAGGGAVTGCARAGPASNLFRHLLARGPTRLQLPSNRQPP